MTTHEDLVLKVSNFKFVQWLRQLTKRNFVLSRPEGRVSNMDGEVFGPDYKIINKQIDPSYTYNDINTFLLDFYSNHTNGFKINLGFGYALHHTISEIYKYHYVSTNNYLFDKAVAITNRKDICDLMNHVISLDLATNYYLKKPPSGWVLTG